MIDYNHPQYSHNQDTVYTVVSYCAVASGIHYLHIFMG